jgi:acyl carrier protein
MNDTAIMAALVPIFRNVFDNDHLMITRDTTAEDIAEWDSMTNITLAIEVESHFHVKFKTAEMEELRTVNDLIALVQSRMAATASPG